MKKGNRRNKRIKIYTMMILSIIILAVGSSIAYQLLTTSDAELEQSSLRLVIVKETGQMFGSAVIFDDDSEYYYALTNEHVIRDASTINALDYEQMVYDVAIVGTSVQRDLALIKIPKENRLKKLKLATEFAVDDPIKSVSYPSSIFRITEGVIDAIEDVAGDDLPIDVITHTAVIDHGSSGGAIVNEDNQIIGITYAGYFDEGILLHSYAIPLEAINNFLIAINYYV